MPSLSYQPLENSRQRTVQLFKRITTIGDGAENDISIPDAGLSDTHAHIHFDGNSFNISCLDKQVILVNNLKVKAHKLDHKDRIRLGETELTTT